MIYLVLLACVALTAVALTPQPEAHMPKLPAPRIMPMMAPATDTVRSTQPLALLFFPLLKILGALIPLPARERDALRNRLSYIGSSLTVEAFAGVKVLSMVAGVLAVSMVLVEFGRMEPLYGLIGAALGFLAPNAWLHSRLKGRNRAIIRLLPEIIDLLTLCIGAGLDFLGALNRVVTVKSFRKRKEPLIEELSVVLQEIKLGKRRFEALKAMAKRVNLPEVSSFVRALVQADRMGTPIGEVLAIHSEDVRMQRFMRAERVALRAPIKILFPLIFFIMPCVAILVGGPIFLQFMRHNPFAKQ